jgi:hypothetical protein
MIYIPPVWQRVLWSLNLQFVHLTYDAYEVGRVYYNPVNGKYEGASSIADGILSMVDTNDTRTSYFILLVAFRVEQIFNTHKQPLDWTIPGTPPFYIDSYFIAPQCLQATSSTRPPVPTHSWVVQNSGVLDTAQERQ